jgi:hypothetical protein
MTTGFPDGKAGLRAGASRSEPLDVSGFTLTGNRNRSSIFAFVAFSS